MFRMRKMFVCCIFCLLFPPWLCSVAPRLSCQWILKNLAGTARAWSEYQAKRETSRAEYLVLSCNFSFGLHVPCASNKPFCQALPLWTWCWLDNALIGFPWAPLCLAPRRGLTRDGGDSQGKFGSIGACKFTILDASQEWYYMYSLTITAYAADWSRLRYIERSTLQWSTVHCNGLQ